MKKLFSALLALVMVVLLVPVNSMAASNYEERIYNYSSIEEMAYEDSSLYAEEYDFDSVVVVNSNSLDSDGLSASGLVGMSNGVICTISNNDSGANLNKLLNGDTSKTIYFIGGNKVISNSFKSRFENNGYKCITLAGNNRIETSYKVANEIKKLSGKVKEIAITSAYKGVPDSVSIAYRAYVRGMPVVLTNGKSIPFSTKGVKTYAIGGNAVISSSLVNKTNAVRLGGKNRYETNRKILKYFGLNKGNYSLCFGDSKGANMKVASLAGCLSYACPVVLVSQYSDKSILSGATYVEYYGYNQKPNNRLRVDCYNAKFGTGISSAVNSAYKVTKENRYSTYYVYNNGDSYVPSRYRKSYYVFNIVDSYGDEYDYNIVVRKSDKKVFVWNAGANKPSSYKRY